MIVVPISADGSSTSPTRPTPGSPPSDRERSRFASPGSGLSLSALSTLARRHGIRPRKSLGQHFLADPNVARAIARDAGAGPGERFLEVGAGLGSLTVALAGAGAEVLAVEADTRLIDPLTEVVDGLPVRVVHADALAADWPELLGSGPWRMASNLPYHAAVPIVLELLARAPAVDPFVVMVQREVGERLAAAPGGPAFGAGSLKGAYHAEGRVLRRIRPTVFWPEPKIESVLLRLDRRPAPVEVAPNRLFGLIEEGFRERRKTMTTALVRRGLDRARARELLSSAGIDPRARAETLGLDAFARLTEALDG